MRDFYSAMCHFLIKRILRFYIFTRRKRSKMVPAITAHQLPNLPSLTAGDVFIDKINAPVSISYQHHRRARILFID